MKDQASRLRDLIKNKNNKKISFNKTSNSNRLIFFISTSDCKFENEIILNLGLEFEKQNSVFIIENNFNNINNNLYFNFISKNNLLDILEYNNIEEVISFKYNNLNILNSLENFYKIFYLDKNIINNFLKQIKKLDTISDMVLINLGKDYNNNNLDLLKHSNEFVIFITNSSNSISEAYSIIKDVVYKQNNTEIPIIYIIIIFEYNYEVYNTYKKLYTVCKKFLNINLYYLGEIFIEACSNNDIIKYDKFNYQIVEISKKILNNNKYKERSHNGLEEFINKLINKKAI